jgi:hypothetical protein
LCGLLPSHGGTSSENLKKIRRTAMTEDELIEKMAREMFPTAWDADHDDPHDDGQISKKYARFKARAALAAIREAGFEVVPREPTEAMAERGHEAMSALVDCSEYPSCAPAYDAWDAMLSASPLKGET